MLEQPHEIGEDRFAGGAKIFIQSSFCCIWKSHRDVGLRDLPSAITLRYFKTRKAQVQTRQATGVP